MLFDGKRQFNRGGVLFGLAMRDRYNKHLCLTLVVAGCENYSARPVFGTVLASLSMFT
jgi:hypothetical protein